MDAEMVKVDPTKLENQVNVVVKFANALEVSSPDAYERGGAGLRQINSKTKQVKDFFKEPKSKANEAHKSRLRRRNCSIRWLQPRES